MIKTLKLRQSHFTFVLTGLREMVQLLLDLVTFLIFVTSNGHAEYLVCDKHAPDRITVKLLYIIIILM